MKDQLHGDEGEEETNPIHDGTTFGQGRRCISLLRDVVVERDDGTCQIKRGVQDVRDVIAAVERRAFRGDTNAITL